MHDTPDVARLRVRMLQTVRPGGDHVQDNHVFCPRRRASVDMATCCGCPRVRRVDQSADGTIEVECNPGVTADALAGAFVHAAPTINVRSDMTLDELATLFARERPRRLAVVDERGRFVGVADENDVYVAQMICARAVALADAHTTARSVVTVHERVSLRDALRTMAAHRVREVPVVDHENRFLGWLDDITALRCALAS